MPSLEILVTFTVAAIVMNLSPGPSNLYVMARSISQGVKSGIVAALGLATGLMIHVVLAALGVSAIFKYSPVVYSFVKLAGAFYLIYLGVVYWKTSASALQLQKIKKKKTNIQIYKESVLVEVTNPKTALFFLAFLPQFVSPDIGPVSIQILLLGCIVTLSAIPCDVVVAFTSTRIINWLSSNRKTTQLQERLSGAILFGLGSFIVAEELID